MTQWDDLRYLLAVHREGTLVAAGRRLGVDATTVGRRVASLEAGLRATLCTRGPDGWRVTPAGARVVEAAERAERAFAEIVREAGGADDAPRGRVRLTTVEVLATRIVVPGLPGLHARYPDLRVDLLCANENLDLARGQADIALRVMRPTEGSLVARRLGSVAEQPYAHRGWLAERGLAADDVRSLEGLDVLTLLGPGERDWLEGLGSANLVLRSNEASTIYAAAAAGLGIARIPDVLAASEPALVPLPALGVRAERPLWVVMHRDLADTARVRVVADFLAERLRSPGELA